MPNNNVKTPKDEKLWTQAKSIASTEYGVKEGSDRFYRITNGIFQRMKGNVKEGTALNPLRKDEFIKIGRQVASEFFENEGSVNLDNLIVKTALMENLNTAQVQNLCATTNHLVHAELLREKQADPDKYVEFEIARPEKIGEMLERLASVPDDVYMDPEKIFRKEAAPVEEQMDYGQFERGIVRRTTILKENIKNISAAYNKVANDIAVEGQRGVDAVDKLYSIIRSAVENGSDPMFLKGILQKVFSDSNNFSLIWADINTRLVADNIIDMPINDDDRSDEAETDNWAPSTSSPMVAVAMDVERRLNKTDELGRALEGLEKMAMEASDELYHNLLLEKEAIIGLVGKAAVGIGKWGLKKAVTTPLKVGFKTVKGSAKALKGIGGKGLMNAGFVGMDAVPAATKKMTKVIQ